MSDNRDHHYNNRDNYHRRDGGYNRDNRDNRDYRDNRDNRDYRNRDDRDHYARDDRHGRYNNINFNPKRKIDYDENEKSLQITRQFDGPRKFVRGRGHGGRGAPRIISGSMVPKAETPMPTQVKLAMKVVTTLGNYSEMTEQDDLIANIRALSNIFLSVGDLTEYAEEISDLFLNCFSTLSIQAPINAALLSLIHIKDQTFTKLVTSKVQKKLLLSLQNDDVPTAKLLLKSIACLCNCKSFAIDSFADGSLLPLLNSLLEVARKNPSSRQLSEEATVALYLVASTVPWCVDVIAALDHGREFLARLQAVASELIRSYQCPYAVGGAQAIFHDVPIPTDEDTAKPLCLAGTTRNPGTRGAYDSLYEAVVACHHILTTVLSASGEGPRFTPPGCMISPWQALQEDLAPLEQGEVDPLHFDSRFFLEVQALYGQKCLGSRARTCQQVGNNISSSVGAAAASSFLQARVPIYDTETSNEAAACSSLSETEKYIANHYFQDILYFFDPIVLEDGTKKGSVELLSVHLLAVFKLFPKETHIEYLLLEQLFGVLLQQPSNPIMSSNIYKLILILCKKTAANNTVAASLTYYSTVFPPALALIVNILYQMVPDMLVGSIVDFSNWFAFHLINTQLSWPYWEFWNDELKESLTDGSGTSAQKIFASHFVLKLSKAVVLEKLYPVLPDAYVELLPLENAHVPKCSFYPPTEPAAEKSEAIMVDGEQPPAQEVDDSNADAVVKTNEPAAAEEETELTPAAKLRKLIEDKISPEDLVEWFENDVMAKDEAATTQWCSVLLLQAILSLGSVNNTLAGITGLLDRYSMVIRSLAHTEVEQQAMLDTLVEAYGFGSAMFLFCLDEMMRRSQIITTAALNWTTPKALQLNQNTTLFTIFELIVDRSVDFVRASMAQRSVHVHVPLPALDASLDLTPTPEPEGVVAMATGESSSAAAPAANAAAEGAEGSTSSTGANASIAEELEEVDYNEDVDAAADQRQGKRQRRGEGEDEEGGEGDEMKAEGGAAAAQEEQQEQQALETTQDQVWLTTEALKTAIGNIRTVYGSVLSTLSKGMAAVQAQPHAPGNGLWYVVAQSLLLKTLRAVHGAERNLAQTYQRPVLLSDVSHKVALYLEGSGAVKEIWNEHFKV